MSMMKLLSSISKTLVRFREINILIQIAIDNQTLKKAVRRVTLQQKGVPVLCGSSIRRKGVQPLLDSVAGTYQSYFLHYYYCDENTD